MTTSNLDLAPALDVDLNLTEFERRVSMLLSMTPVNAGALRQPTNLTAGQAHKKENVIGSTTAAIVATVVRSGAAGGVPGRRELA